MAKPTKHASLICTILTIIAVIGIIISLILHSPIPILILLIPTAIYEIYRTEGESTKISSIILGIIIILELILIIFKIDVNIGNFLGEDTRYIAGYEIKLGLLSIIGPSIMAILTIILFVRTRGVYTRWLAAIIFFSSFVIVRYLIRNVHNVQSFDSSTGSELRINK